jgi:hypothetical protein
MAKTEALTVMPISPAIRNRRLSTMSTTAPAGIARRNTGKVAAT